MLAVRPPSSPAVALARERRMLLCGLVGGEGFNVYAGAGRLSGISGVGRGEPSN